MIVALDVDDTVTAHPLFFKALYNSWVIAGGSLPIFITARPESQRSLTLATLQKLGINAQPGQLHMFPEEYSWPWTTEDETKRMKTAHSQWKARKCLELGVSVLVDDCSHNVEACRAAGVFVLQVMAPTMKESLDRLRAR